MLMIALLDGHRSVLDETQTVMENLLSVHADRAGVWANWFRRFSGEDIIRAHELLDRVGLNGMENTRCGALSGGQRHRMAAARALIQQPDEHCV